MAIREVEKSIGAWCSGVLDCHMGLWDTCGLHIDDPTAAFARSGKGE